VSATPSRLIRLVRVPSTMDALHELAQAGAAPGTAVIAEEQTAGRGSRGRTWTSPRGGLWVSVLARPASAGLELVSLRSGLAVADALDRLGIGELRLKWPNDLMLGDRKAGGILCEARWQGTALAWVVIGLGLNVTNPPAEGLDGVATHLASVRPGLTPAELARPVIEALRDVDAAGGPLTAGERAHFARRDWLRGRALAAPEAGIADGIDADGALRVRGAEGTMATVRAGTVALAGTSATADLRPCS
jgi:BirA family transcriptional regulator, biotin operon repressor / biotin---[acetyl-CoA-carboxylase] ligase